MSSDLSLIVIALIVITAVVCLTGLILFPMMKATNQPGSSGPTMFSLNATVVVGSMLIVAVISMTLVVLWLRAKDER